MVQGLYVKYMCICIHLFIFYVNRFCFWDFRYFVYIHFFLYYVYVLLFCYFLIYIVCPQKEKKIVHILIIFIVYIYAQVHP